MFTDRLERGAREGKIPPKFAQILKNFYKSYVYAIEKNGHSIDEYEPVLDLFLKEVIAAFENPQSFEPYHEGVRSPVDYYALGLDLLRPLVIFEKSKALGLDHLTLMKKQLAQGENVILFANHQTEPDPQAISLLLEKTAPEFSEEMIFVAGQRVTSDPLAIPLSLGRNLLCIYSKKHIEHPPEKKEEKLLHNQKTMRMMGDLLKQGGKCIYVAPSGGRDRRNAQGVVSPAPLDPASLEMFLLIAAHAGTSTHFYTLALSTYHLLPPPSGTEKELGEKREAQCTPIHLAFGKELDMRHFPGSEGLGKKELRQARARFIWQQIDRDYQNLLNGISHA